MPFNNNSMMQFIQMIQMQKNPQQYLLGMLDNSGSAFNQNLSNLIKGNKMNEVETIMRNLFQARGLDFDKEFNDFKQMLGTLNK